jgi:hypothetical protein
MEFVLSSEPTKIKGADEAYVVSVGVIGSGDKASSMEDFLWAEMMMIRHGTSLE